MIQIPATFRDFDIMARTLYGEARGEPWAGMVAVAWVIRNRAEADLGNDDKPDWWGEGIGGVCQKPWQFSCWNKKDPMRAKIVAATAGKLAACLQACFAVLAGETPDPTGGATHYYADYIAAPPWATGVTPTVVIGRHLFFNLLRERDQP